MRILWGHSGRLLGDLCGLTPRRRRQPSGWQRHSRRACLTDQGRGGHRGGGAGTPWRLGRSCHPTRLALQLAVQQCTQVPQNGAEGPFSPICVHSFVPTSVYNVATAYTNAPERLREVILANLCTPLRVTHGRSRDRAGPRVPRRRRPHGPRDARALEPDAHAAGAVTQPPTHTSSRSLFGNAGFSLKVPLCSPVCLIVACRRPYPCARATLGPAWPRARISA